MTQAPDPDLLAATSFFNALLRETSAWRLTSDGSGCGGVIRLPLANGSRLCITLRYRSRGGRCRLELPLLVETPGSLATAGVAGESVEAIGFLEAVERLMKTPELFGEVGHTQRREFIERVRESRDNIADSLKVRDDLAALSAGPLSFLHAEQGLLVGHDFHPAPKSRAPFTLAQARRLCPEYRTDFQLVWWAVAPELAVGDSSRRAPAAALMRELLPTALADSVPNDFVVLPMHPWQADFVAERDDVGAHLEAGRLIRLGEGKRRWAPTSSHRSLYSDDAAWMIKGSLSARLTNSVRELHASEVERGLRLDRWWCELSPATLGTFRLMQEPAWLGWRLDSRTVDEASLVLLRDNTITDPDSERAVLATLTQRLYSDRDTLLTSRVRHHAQRYGLALDEAACQWFEAFCEHALLPLTRLVVEEGIVLLGHQQNIVMRLDEGLPTGVDYRDCQGSGVTARFFELHPDAEVPDDHRISDTMLKRYFPYYVLLNSTLAVTGALAEDELIDEARLLAQLRDHLEALDATLEGDHQLLEHLLRSPTLEAKGNFFCYLAGINESTLDDPSRIYRRVANPLVETVS